MKTKLLLIFLSFFMFSNLATAKLKVAIIGGGGAGVTTAWLLDNDAETERVNENETHETVI